MKNYSLSLLFILLSLCLYGQKSKAQLEKEKQENLKKLQQTSKILEETKKQKTASLGQLQAIKEKEKIQKSIIQNISSEIGFLDSEIGENELILKSLKHDLDVLKKEYAEMIYEESKAGDNYNTMMFLFTSTDFYDLIMRINYLDQYTKARKNQVVQINKVSAVLNDQKRLLLGKKQEKQTVLNTQIIEQKNLVALESEKESMIKQLAQDEKKLKKQIDDQKKNIAALEKMISDIVKQEMAKNKTSTGGKGTTLKLTPEATILSKNFAENMGRLIWPVEYGFIYLKFGEQYHPTIKGVKIDNIGVDIQTKKGAQVRAVFDGEVIAVANVPGMNKMVMVQHGEYFTIYANVINVFVKKGDKIKRKDWIGVADTGENDVTTMQFQIWKNADKLDPQLWLVKQ